MTTNSLFAVSCQPLRACVCASFTSLWHLQVRMGFALAHSPAFVNPPSFVKPACSKLVSTSCFRSVEFTACLLCLLHVTQRHGLLFGQNKPGPYVKSTAAVYAHASQQVGLSCTPVLVLANY